MKRKELDFRRGRGALDSPRIILAYRPCLVVQIWTNTQIENDVETSPAIANLLGLDGISIELCFVSKHAHPCIDVARISLADAALQLQVHFFAASRIFLAEYLGIDRGLLVHRFVIGLENGTFAEAVIRRELDAIGKGKQRLLVTLADAADVNRDQCHAQTSPFAAQNLVRDPAGADAAWLQDNRRTRIADRAV